MDRISEEKRKWNMSRVRSKNTKPEIQVRSALHKMGYRFRLHGRQLPGIPDVVLPKHKIVIFIHGCFWHGHNSCKAGSIPKTRPQFWRNKIFENKSRDRREYTKLQETGWRIAIVWECALRNNVAVSGTFRGLDEWIRSGLDNLELPNDNQIGEQGSI